MSFRSPILAIALGWSAISSFAAPVEIIPLELRGAVQPQIAVSPDGRIHVVFGRENAIYHTSSLDGRTFSPAVKVGALEKLALRVRRGPRVVATDKLITVAAISHVDGNLHAWTSGDGGQTWKEGAPLNTSSKSAREGMQALAGDGVGLVVAVWLDDRSGGKELWSRASHDGGLIWQPDARVYASPDGHVCECCQPSVAIGPHGEVAAMWRNWLDGSRDLWLATSKDGGQTFGTAQKLGTGTWKFNACPMDGGSVTFDALGKPLTVWRREKTVFVSRNDAPEQLLASRAQQPVVNITKDGPLFVWEQDGGLILRRGASAAARLADRATAPAVGRTREGNAVVVWESSTTAPPTMLAEVLR